MTMVGSRDCGPGTRAAIVLHSSRREIPMIAIRAFRSLLQLYAHARLHQVAAVPSSCLIRRAAVYGTCAHVSVVCDVHVVRCPVGERAMGGGEWGKVYG